MTVEIGLRHAAQHALQPTAPSALVVSRPFGFVGILVQSGGPPHPALRLSSAVSQTAVKEIVFKNGNLS